MYITHNGAGNDRFSSFSHSLSAFCSDIPFLVQLRSTYMRYISNTNKTNEKLQLKASTDYVLNCVYNSVLCRPNLIDSIFVVGIGNGGTISHSVHYTVYACIRHSSIVHQSSDTIFPAAANITIKFKMNIRRDAETLISDKY